MINQPFWIFLFKLKIRNWEEDFLNALMDVYDSLNIEDKNRISINSLQFYK